MLEWISKIWDVNDDKPNQVDVIALVSYGAYEDNLTAGSLQTCITAQQLQRLYPEAKVIYGVYSKNPCGADEARKVSFISLNNTIYVGVG